MSEWFAGDVLAGGIGIHYYRTGGRKPPVVLLHGVTDNGLCWARLARALQARYDLIMVDARGHGLSDAPEAGYSPDDQAADVAGLIKGLGLGRPVVMGHSMGAATAMATAARFAQHVGSLVLEDPPLFAPSQEQAGARAAEAAQWRAGILANRARTVEELANLCRTQNPTWDEAECTPWAESKRQVSPNIVAIVGAFSMDWQEAARCITCPVLLITADTDKGALVSPEMAQQALALWPKGRLAHIPGAGHNIRREQFEAYLQAVTGFLAEVTR